MAHCLLPAFEHDPVLLLGHGGQAEFLAARIHGRIGCKGGDQEGIVFRHELGGVGIQQVAVLDAAHPVFHRVPDRRHRVGVRADIGAAAGRLGGDGADFLGGVLRDF